jgi:hypothetical protein
MAELLPIDELIVQNVIAVLDAVAPSATTQNTLDASAPSAASIGDIATDCQVLVAHASKKETGGIVTGKQDWELTLKIVGQVIVSESAAAGTARKRLTQLAADIRNALMADRYRGTHAWNTRFGAVEYDETGKPPFVGLTVMVDYRTSSTNDYTH